MVLERRGDLLVGPGGGHRLVPEPALRVVNHIGQGFVGRQELGRRRLPQSRANQGVAKAQPVFDYIDELSLDRGIESAEWDRARTESRGTGDELLERGSTVESAEKQHQARRLRQTVEPRGECSFQASGEGWRPRRQRLMRTAFAPQDARELDERQG